MKRLRRVLGVAVVVGMTWAGWGQPVSQVPLTSYSLQLLQAANQSNAWYVLGIVGTNQTKVTNWVIAQGTWIGDFDADGNALTNASEVRANAWQLLSDETTVGWTWVQLPTGDMVAVGGELSEEAVLTNASLALSTNGDVYAKYLSGNGGGLTNLNGTNIQAGTINSNKLDVATAAQLALVGGGTGTELTVGTNVFGIVSNYVAGVYSQTTSLIIQGSTNTTANGVYSQAYSNYVEGVITALWTNGIANGIAFFDDGSDGIINITNASGVPLFKPDLYYWLPTFPFGQVLVTADGLHSDGEFAWTSNTVAEPYWQLQGWKADTNFYAEDIHGKVIYGDLSGSTNYQFTSVGGVQTSNLLSTVNINETLRHSFAAPVMGFVGGSLLGSSEATAIGIARYLYANGLTAAGYNLVCLDANWASRDENGLPILATNLYPSGLASLLNALATNDCRLGLYVSMWLAYGDLKINESTAYRDAYTMASWGIGWLKCDGGQEDVVEGGESAVKHIGELLAAGLDDGAADKGYPPIFFHYNVSTNRLFSTRFANGIYATQPVKDAVGSGDSVATTAHRAFASMYAFVTNAPNITGRGVWPSILNCGDGSGYSYWDTNCARANMGLHCLEPWVLLIGDDLFKATHIGIYTNREAIRINQDAAVGGATWLSTNCVPITNAVSQKARWRRMANGDIAVGLWNWDTNNPSLFTLNLTKLPFLQTNVAYVLNVFDNVGQLVTNSIDQLVNTNGYNLLRISKTATIYNGAVLTNGASFAVTLSNSPLVVTKTSPTANEAMLEIRTSDDASRFKVDEDGDVTFDGTMSSGSDITCGGMLIGTSSRFALYGLASSTMRISGNNDSLTNMVFNYGGPTNVSMRIYGGAYVAPYSAPTLAIVNGAGGVANAMVGGSLTVTNGLLISSNSFVNVPTLYAGQNFYCSSNGVPHVIWSDEAGTLHTNRLVE